MNDAGMFSKRDAQRIANTVLAHERRGTDSPPVKYPTMRTPAGASKLGRTASAWTKGTSKVLTIYDQGTPLNETTSTPATTVTAYNKFADVAAGKWVMVSLFRGEWYLTAAEC